MKQSRINYSEANYPLTYRTDVCAQLFESIHHGMSCSFLGMKDNQKTNVLRFISRRVDVQNYYLGKETSGFMFLLLNLNQLPQPSLVSFYQLLLTVLLRHKYRQVVTEAVLQQITIDNPVLLLQTISTELEDLIQKTGKTIVFLLNNFELLRDCNLEQLGRNIFAIDQNINDKIIFVFTGNRPFLSSQHFFNKIVWMTPFAGKEAVEVVERNLALYHHQASLKQIKEIVQLSGGHAGTIKFLVQSLPGKNQSDVWFQCQRILSSLSEVEQMKLRNGQADDLLLKLGVQTKHTDHYAPFSPLLHDYLYSHQSNLKPFCFDQENNEIYYWGMPLGNTLTRKEFTFLKTLVSQPTQIFPKEQLMDLVWGESTYPSDWAFDKLVSRLRKKLLSLHFQEDVCISIRGQGVRLL